MIIERMKETRPGETICLSYEECEEVLKLIEEQEERISIMSEGGWHFSGTPEIPASKNQVTVIVWTESGQVRTLDYCRTLESKKVYWCCSTQKARVKAWRYMPKPPKEGEQEAQQDYERSVEYAQYCERYEPTYNPEDGSM